MKDAARKPSGGLSKADQEAYEKACQAAREVPIPPEVEAAMQRVRSKSKPT